MTRHEKIRTLFGASGRNAIRTGAQKIILIFSCIWMFGPELSQGKTAAEWVKISASADLVGTALSRTPQTRPTRLDVRSVELLLHSPVDYLFHGTLSLAGHLESGVVALELHEAFLGSTQLIPHSRFRVGQFFLTIGRLNHFHQHEWPFISAPEVHQTFFDTEGVFDTGLEYAILFPFLPFYLDLTLGLTNGWTFGHSHNEGRSPKFPTCYGRLATFGSFSETGGIMVGFNALIRQPQGLNRVWILGIDTTAKFREPSYVALLIQSEIWLRNIHPRTGSDETALGGYLFPNYFFSPVWGFGIRLDALSVLTLKTASGTAISNLKWALVPTITLKPSEFTTFRLAGTLDWMLKQGRNTLVDHRLEFQVAFNLGDHPTHEF
jgi:hypothetical protein